MTTYEKLQKKLQTAKNRRIYSTQIEVTKIMQEINDEINSTLAKIYTKYDLPLLTDGKPDGAKTLAFMRQKVKSSDAGKISRLNALQKEIQSIIGPGLLKKDKLIEQMAKIAYQDGYYWNAWAMEMGSGVSLGFPLIDEGMINQAVYNNPFSIFKVSDKTLETVDKLRWDRKLVEQRINREIAMGIGRGDDYKTLARKVDTVLGFRDPVTGKVLERKIGRRSYTADAMRIVRTELPRVYQEGHTEEYLWAQEKGIETRLKLVAVLDTRTRQQSASMDGQTSDEEGRFQYPDGNWYFPHNTGIAKWDINDRETTIQIIEGYEPKIRRQRDQGLIEYKSFNEWAKDNGIEKSMYGQRYWPEYLQG